MWSDFHSRNIVVLMVLFTVLALLIAFNSTNDELKYRSQPSAVGTSTPKASGMEAEVREGIHQPTGLIADAGYELVVTNCTACHASDIIINNRFTADGWVNVIRWMQERQNLWDLGAKEGAIVDYLARNYAPKAQGRRKNLEIAATDWYVLQP